MTHMTIIQAGRTQGFARTCYLRRELHMLYIIHSVQFALYGRWMNWNVQGCDRFRRRVFCSASGLFILGLFWNLVELSYHMLRDIMVLGLDHVAKKMPYFIIIKNAIFIIINNNIIIIVFHSNIYLCIYIFQTICPM